MAEDGVGVGRVAEVLVTLAFYEVVGLGVYLGVFHTAALVSTLEPGSITGTVAAAPGVVLVGPDARLVAGGLALFAGMSAFVEEDTPGVGDLYGSDAPSGLTYPFYALRVGRGTLLGTAVGAAFGAGLYLVVVHTDALGRGRGPEAGGRPPIGSRRGRRQPRRRGGGARRRRPVTATRAAPPTPRRSSTPR